MVTSLFTQEAVLNVLKTKDIQIFNQLLKGGLGPHTLLKKVTGWSDMPLIFATTYFHFEPATLILLSQNSFLGQTYLKQSLLEFMVEQNQLQSFTLFLKQGLHPQKDLEQTFWQIIRLHFKNPVTAKSFFQQLFSNQFSLFSVMEDLKKRNLDMIIPILLSYYDETVLQNLSLSEKDKTQKRL